jgi:CheY-like chemotaxis protein
MKTVLVADDKASSRELIRTVPENSGYAVVEAGDGIEALRNAP